MIFAQAFGMASVRSQSLDQPLVPGVFLQLFTNMFFYSKNVRFGPKSLSLSLSKISVFLGPEKVVSFFVRLKTLEKRKWCLKKSKMLYNVSK